MTEDQARERVIRSMCPERVCRTCGEPSTRMTARTYENALNGEPLTAVDGWRVGRGGIERGMSDSKIPAYAHVKTLGWTDCGHDDWRPGVWLDPFNPDSQ